MSEIRFDRLLKLAKHLQSGKLGHKRFDFNNVHTVPRSMKSKVIQDGFCGTAGCAMGELPIIFPNDWKFEIPDDGCTYPSVKYKDETPGWYMNIDDDRVMEYFDISCSEYEHLFYPQAQIQDYIFPDRKGKMLSKTATKFEVAQNIEWFCHNKGFRKEE